MRRHSVENKLLAYELMLKKTGLTNKDIMGIFGINSTATVGKIKKPVLEEMAKNQLTLPQGYIHLGTAYRMWGLEEDELERNYAKAMKFKMVCT